MNQNLNEPESNERRLIREDIEWCDIWQPHLNEHDLPRVLLIGDSITRAYYPDVERILQGQAYVARLSTSRCVCDPGLLTEVTTVLGQTSFEVIHFNNGLHGPGYTEGEYEEDLREFVRALQALAPQASLIWASSTPVRVPGNLQQFGEFNERVKTRNAAAAAIVEPLSIPINDLHAVAQLSHYVNDGVHFNSDGALALAEQVARIVAEAI